MLAQRRVGARKCLQEEDGDDVRQKNVLVQRGLSERWDGEQGVQYLDGIYVCALNVYVAVVEVEPVR